tara:strand:+ start:1119 stop:2369 length:1251 start_codon:yes stop_codon:yes gene_type:complete
MNLLKYIFIAIIFTFIGYKNPSLIENPKKYIKFYSKKLGLSKTFTSDVKQLEIIKENKDLDILTNIETVEGNSFDLNYRKVLNFDDRTAGFYITLNDDNPNFEIFLQDGIKITNNTVKEMNLPLNISFEKNGGIKSVFKKNDINFAIVSSKKIQNCYYASIYNLELKQNILKTDCLPDYENVDFNGLGGAFINYEDNLVLSIGAPEWNSNEIRNLAQKENSLYGKTIIIKDNFLNSDSIESIKKEDVEIFTKGHKNPQGITLIDNKIYSVEHGPQGGDELNLLKKSNNYGWPLVSYGTLYNNGKSFLKKSNDTSAPIYTFLPSIAPSSINKCPSNLKSYYKENYCIMILSLRGMSLFIALIDKKDSRLISLEKFLINQRLRHFGLNSDNEMFQKNNNFYISVDNEGIYEIEFNNFR